LQAVLGFLVVYPMHCAGLHTLCRIAYAVQDCIPCAGFIGTAGGTGARTWGRGGAHMGGVRAKGGGGVLSKPVRDAELRIFRKLGAAWLFQVASTPAGAGAVCKPFAPQPPAAWPKSEFQFKSRCQSASTRPLAPGDPT
jgi:hypothetical protein